MSRAGRQLADSVTAPLKPALKRPWFLLITLALVSGCAVPPGGGGGGDRDASSSALPGVDPERAYLSLSDIEPSVDPPRASESQGKPAVSARSARQIVKSQRLIDEERYTEASLALERALRYDPDHPTIHRTLATLHWQAGNVERARTHADRALEGNPDDAVSHYIVGRCHAFDGNNAAAITAYRTALKCSNLAEHPKEAALCRFHLAEALEAEGYLTAALEQYTAFEEAASTPADESESSRTELPHAKRILIADAKSSILERLGRFADAAKAIEAVPTGAQDDVPRRIRCARLWMRAGHLEKALAVVRAIQSGNDEIIALLRELHERMGKPGAIVDDLRRWRIGKPDEPVLVLHLSDALVRLGRGDEARGELERFLERHAASDKVRLRFVDLLIEQKRWDEALDQCGQGIEQTPDQGAEFEAKIRQLGESDEAAAHLLQPKTGAEPGAVLSTYVRGLLALAAGRSEQAEELLRSAHSSDSAFLPARVALARLYLHAYRYDEALKVAGRTSEENTVEDVRLEKLLGDIYERLDDLDRAELHYKAAVQQNRVDPEAAFSLAQVLQRSGQVNRARLQLRVLLDQHPAHYGARRMLAMLYLGEDKKAAAVGELQELRKVAKEPAVLARCDALLGWLRDRDLAAYRNALLEALEQYGSDADTWLDLAGSYDEDEQDHAKDAYQHALAEDPDNEEAAIGLVFAEQRQLAFESAAARLKELLPRRPNRHTWRLRLIALYSLIQDHEAALAVARIEEAREDIDVETRRRYRRRIIRSLRSLQQDAQALEQRKQWAQADPQDENAAINLAEEYINQGQAEQAVAIYEGFLGSSPSKHGHRGGLINALREAGRYDRAYQYVLDWLNEDPENDVALRVLVAVLVDADRVEDALELVNNKLLRTHNREGFQDLAAAVLWDAHRFEEGIRRTEALIAVVGTLLRTVMERGRGDLNERPSDEQLMRLPDEPTRIGAMHERLDQLNARVVEMLIAGEKYQDAQERIHTLLATARDARMEAGYLALLAACEQLLGREEQAAKTSERALALQPQNVRINNDVAYGWIDSGIRLDEAERMIRFALSREPDQVAYLDTFGWLLYKKGSFADARKWLLRARGAGDDVDPVIFDHLGDACWRAGDSAEAIKYWTASVGALAETPEKELRKDERSVLEQTQGKIDAAGAGREPEIAPLAVSPAQTNGEE